MKSRAFTLIETMVVVTIIAIVTAIGVTSYSRYSAKGKWAEVQPCIANVAIRMQEYYSNIGSYPTADIWGAIYNEDPPPNPELCGDHYAGTIEVFGDGPNDTASRFIITFTDSQRRIRKNSTLPDTWVMTDSSDNLYHTSNSVEEVVDISEVPDIYRSRL